jgi:hypothetical protein
MRVIGFALPFAEDRYEQFNVWLPAAHWAKPWQQQR